MRAIIHSIVLGALALSNIAKAEYCTFYSDKGCSTRANTVEYGVGNPGYISPGGQYVVCQQGRFSRATVKPCPEADCQAAGDHAYEIENDKCIDLGGPHSSYRITATAKKAPKRRRHVKKAKTAAVENRWPSECIASLRTWANKDCRPMSDYAPANFHVKVSKNKTLSSGCFTRYDTIKAVSVDTSKCRLMVFANGNCSGAVKKTVQGPSLFCEATGLKGGDKATSYMWECDPNACD